MPHLAPIYTSTGEWGKVKGSVVCTFTTNNTRISWITNVRLTRYSTENTRTVLTNRYNFCVVLHKKRFFFVLRSVVRVWKYGVYVIFNFFTYGQDDDAHERAFCETTRYTKWYVETIESQIFQRDSKNRWVVMVES